jgi:hypothetical protein
MPKFRAHVPEFEGPLLATVQWQAHLWWRCKKKTPQVRGQQSNAHSCAVRPQSNKMAYGMDPTVIRIARQRLLQPTCRSSQAFCHGRRSFSADLGPGKAGPGWKPRRISGLTKLMAEPFNQSSNLCHNSVYWQAHLASPCPLLQHVQCSLCQRCRTRKR